MAYRFARFSFYNAGSELCGLIGLNGSGKTTLLSTILGFKKPEAGVCTDVSGISCAEVG
ncbi:ATP-binding cassette domain-containing protein [Burkholderia vietnamiensis]|uniref:ATP-binding cassette domain-containing protein n=1 Tax=Burkholderia vietnamiensis TaxID=60552 RepID=UPI00352F70E9